VLGIDHGTVRIGLALSDESGAVARPLATMPEENALDRLPALIQDQNVGAIVLGMPLRRDGSEGPAAQRVREFFEQLRPLVPAGIPIHLRDESHSTLEAASHLRTNRGRRRARREAIDPVAAAVILQEFLDEREFEV